MLSEGRMNIYFFIAISITTVACRGKLQILEEKPSFVDGIYVKFSKKLIIIKFVGGRRKD